MLPEVEGTYQVQGVGTSTGTYRIAALRMTTDTSPIVIKSLTGTITAGVNFDFTFDAPPPPPIYLPIIFKNSIGAMPTLTIPDTLGPIFTSPIKQPKQENN
ncbi:MAG: hypothetical protein Kow0031_24610 [Anaerolineae bacterium]